MTIQNMGLLTWIMLIVVILSIIGQGWNVFVASIFRGLDKILSSISPIARDLDKIAKDYAASNFTKNVADGFGMND
ncbi:MAG TPA: hypothetical protein VE619_11585 [Nitrososphaeraceae archaeon]|nr:hypothetical protein [Nitrososphaeraceae archaeon]